MYSICFVCDFFHPKVGGVENHIYNLSKQLISLGHNIIIITHKYEGLEGIQYVDGLKTYYIDTNVIQTLGISLLNPFTYYTTLKNILSNEKINIVHGHQFSSPMTHLSIFYANMLGYDTYYTEHSINTNILMNHILKFTLSRVRSIVCVSHTCREILCYNTGIVPQKCYVIPNAIDSFIYKPVYNNDTTFNILCVCRLEYRKGISLLIQVIPIICSLFNVNFTIIGNGSMRPCLEKMIDKYSLKKNVILTGDIKPKNVVSYYNKSNLFLTCSLMETFCMTNLEAASCGIHVISTNVGGIPEVLPDDYITLCKPTVECISYAIIDFMNTNHYIDKHARHKKISEIYSWKNIAKRTLKMYRQK